MHRVKWKLGMGAMGNAAKHKSNLVQAAIRLFREQGYAATGLNQILAASGAPKGSLYHYFPGGKEELGATAVALAGGVVTQTLQTLAKGHHTMTDFVAAYADLLAKWLEDSEFRSGCPIATTLLETVPASEAITKAGRRAFEDWIEVVASVEERGGVSPAEAKRHAEFTIAAVEGALLLSRVKQSTDPIRMLPHFVASGGRN
ncbi:MAG: TetR/AcrR family transcriptional regulator [Myxococcota bacterium]